MKNICTEQWWTAITRNSTESGLSNKLKFYSLLKADFEIEPYLENVNDFHLRKNICKLRCSDHKLEIETGRHKNLTLDYESVNYAILSLSQKCILWHYMRYTNHCECVT